MRYLRVETITSDYDEAHVLIFSLQMDHVSELCMYAYGILRLPQNSTPSLLYYQRQLERGQSSYEDGGFERSQSTP